MQTRIGDRILVRDQPDPRENGVWLVSTRGESRDIWIRADDQLQDGCATIIQEGVLNADGIFYLTNGAEWLQITGAGSP